MRTSKWVIVGILLMAIFNLCPMSIADTVSYTYDDFGRLTLMTNIDATKVTKIGYNYDNVGNFTNQTTTVGILVNMPDANLRNAVYTALGKNPADPLTRDDMANLTTLSAAGKGISDLTGLEWAVNLTSADLRNNNISSNAPLSGLTHLTSVQLDGNPVNSGAAAVPAMGPVGLLMAALLLMLVSMRKKLSRPRWMFAIAFLGLSLSVSSVNAADGPAGPGWLEVQGTQVTPEQADAYYKSLAPMNTQTMSPQDMTISPMSATTVTPEISALARALKYDPKLIYEHVRNNIDYVPYFGSLKGATLTNLDASGNDFDQASLMISLLRESMSHNTSITNVQYVYGQQWILTYGDGNQKDMQHWLGVDANGSVFTTVANVLANGGIPYSQSGYYFIVNRVWVQATINGTNYVFDPAFKPHQTISGIDLKTAMNYSKTGLLSATGGTVGTDYVQNLNEAGLKTTLDGYTMNLANYIKANYPNASTSEIIGGSKIVPQTLTSFQTNLDFANTISANWTDIPDTYVHKVRIKHGGIDQTLNIPDLAGQKLSIVYRSGSITTASAMMVPVTTDPQVDLAPLAATTVDYVPTSTPVYSVNNAAIDGQLVIVPTGALNSTLPNYSVPSASIDGKKSDLIQPMSGTYPADFGSIYPASSGASSSSIAFGPITNPNTVTVQIVVTLTSNPQGAYSITQYSGTNNVGAGASINPTVVFSNSGQSAGTKTGQLHIQWFYGGSPISGADYYYNLTGYVANAMSLGGYGLNVQAFMNTPYTGTARVNNNGSLPLSVTAKTLTGTGAARFQFVSGNGAASIPASSYQDIQVKYLADVHGTQTASINMGFTYDGMTYGATNYLPLQGQAIYKPDSTGSYGLNVQSYMNTPYIGTARLKNNGVVSLTVNPMTLTGTGAARFQFVSGNGATTIPAGGYQDIQVKYLADVHGSQTANIHIDTTFDGLAYPIDLPLQGQTVYSPSFTGSLGFNAGAPYLGNPVDGTAHLVNAGTQAVTITGFSVTGTDAARFTITGGNSLGDIAAGGFRDINIHYLANSVGTHAATLHVTFTYDGVANSIDLNLAGQTVSTPVAQLWLDDTMLAEEVEPVIGSDLNKMTVSVTHQYVGNFADQSVDYNLKRGSTYAIIYDFGGSRLGRVLEKRERQMQTYRESGYGDTSRQVLTESLNVIGMTWMRDTTLNDNLLSQISGVIDLRQHRFGVVAQESGYYIDVKAQMSAVASIHGDSTAKDAYFKGINHLASAMEHGVLEQMQSNSPSVSTVKLLQLNNANAKKVFMVTSANYATIQPQLSNYSTQDLSDFQTSVNNGSTLILPENGKIALQAWAGKGYIDFSTGTTSQHVGMIIGGGYNGGYGAIAAPVAIAPVNAQVNLNILPQPNDCKVVCNDPVNMVTGIWEYNNTDLVLSGGMGGLALKHSYNSGNNNIKASMGYGWSHNYRLYVEPHSSSPFGLGQRQPLDASALIVASVVTLDVMNGTSDLKSWLVGALIGKWGMDNLTNYAASVHLETDVLTFVKLPDGSFVSPPGTTTKLALNGTYRVDERFSRTINFGSDNNVSSLTDADGNTVSFTYSGGKLQKVNDNFGHYLNFVYTGNLLTSVTDSGSRGVSFGYDGSNNLTSYTDPESKIWTYGYDGNHRVLTMKNPLLITMVTNVYDSFGRIQTQTMPTQSGTTTHNLYFSSYRNIDEDGSGHQSIFYFDDDKRLLASENALGKKTIKSYDGQNHVISETDPKGYTFRYLYDGNNNLTRVTDPFGKYTYNTYDSQFRLTDVTDPLGHITHIDFDTKHHPYKTTVYPSNGKTIYNQKSYYPNGLVNTTTDGKGVVTTLTQDSYGNPATTKTSTAPAITYVYDPIGRITSLTDQEGAKTTFSYDKRSLLKSKTDPLGKIVTLNYYDDGTLNTITDRNNKTTTYTYTPSGKTNTITYQGGARVTYTYDNNDNLTGMLDSIGSTTYSYDAVNRLTNSIDPRNFAIAYDRDENGNIKKITYPGNKTVSYTYDAKNRVKTVTIDWLAKTATYNYDDAGRMTDLTQFNGTYTRYTFDNANRMTGLENRLPNAGSPIATYSYTLDDNGNRTGISSTVPIGLNVTAANNNFTMNLPQKNRLMQAGSTSFTYDNEGQLATKTGETYTFDDSHRVVSITGTVNYQYKYDGAGNRLEATRNGAVTRYIYDANGNLLAEADGTNTITRYYIYGDGVLGIVTSGDALYSYHFDGTGHTVALTDASTNVVNKYAYTPFGAIANQQEAISQPFKYAGKFGVMTEQNGINYMKARYYDPQVGRFVSEDPKSFDGGDVNLMAYVANNPVMFVDPEGLMASRQNLTELNARTQQMREIGNQMADAAKSGNDDKFQELYQQRAQAYNNSVKPQIYETAFNAPMGTTIGGPLPTSPLDVVTSFISDKILSHILPTPSFKTNNIQMMKCH